MDKAQIQSFFDSVRHIREKYDAVESVTAEKFNVFSILRVDNAELQHSRFLTELLNPNGLHQQGIKFLELFCKQLGIEGFDYLKAKINIEKSTDDGRIDIWIDDEKSVIVIENKIYAGDQDQQLLRYHTVIDKRFPKAYLFYLNLWGTQPSEQSKQGLKEGKDFTIISYKTDISKWLESCLKEVTLVPIVRETIRQYLNLVKNLTGQSLNRQFIMEMIDILKKDGNFRFVNQISEAYIHLKIKTQISFWAYLEKLLILKDYKVEKEISRKTIEEDVKSFYFDNRNKSTFYGLSFTLCDNFKDKYLLKFKIGINSEGVIYYGLNPYHNSSKKKCDKDYVHNKSSELKKLRNDLNKKGENRNSIFNWDEDSLLASRVAIEVDFDFLNFTGEDIRKIIEMDFNYADKLDNLHPFDKLADEIDDVAKKIKKLLTCNPLNL
ncbi:MAG: PD-(D/E)XK nuclease family protein [Thermonemataceae bacterium]|nr:PD-(D/E)XK nuclease family protein [Thermonemataceae bacterium]